MLGREYDLMKGRVYKSVIGEHVLFHHLPIGVRVFGLSSQIECLLHVVSNIGVVECGVARRWSKTHCGRMSWSQDP